MDVVLHLSVCKCMLMIWYLYELPSVLVIFIDTLLLSCGKCPRVVYVNLVKFGLYVCD